MTITAYFTDGSVSQAIQGDTLKPSTMDFELTVMTNSDSNAPLAYFVTARVDYFLVS